MLAATPRSATLPILRTFHHGLRVYRSICASIVPPRGVNLSLWTSLPTLPAWHTLWSTRLELPVLGFCAFGPFSRCLFGFSTAASLPGVLRCIGVWFLWLYYIPSVGSSVHDISGTRQYSLHVGFDFCHSRNAIPPYAHAWNINTWTFSFTGDTSGSQRSRRPHRGCLAHARSLAGCVARSHSRASNGVYGTYPGLRWTRNGIYFS
jgi:hypothetical protein